MTQRDRKKKRNLVIVAEFSAMLQAKRSQPQAYRLSSDVYDEVTSNLAEKYFLSECTIARILKNPEGTSPKTKQRYINPRQTSLDI
jgi:hypothetical protein